MKPIAHTARPALAKLIRLLSSDVDGEVVAAARAMTRTLRSVGNDLHDLADLVKAPSTLATNSYARSGGTADNSPPNWRVLAIRCAARLELFNTKERRFIRQMQDWRGVASPKQINWLTTLYAKLRRTA
jgi:hypothetical protein